MTATGNIPNKYQTMPTPALVQRIANKYDNKEDYKEEWEELVYRVGQQEAERLVDLA